MELRTPLGCRDLLSRDVAKRHALTSRIRQVFDRFGFEEVHTPAVEYYQTYAQAFSSLQDPQMIKLFDENMDILALRLDMTVPIARLAATALKNAHGPLRLSYASDVWKRRKTFSGRPAQTSDAGVELIGSSDNLEILVCALEALQATGLDDWTLELSDARLIEHAAFRVFRDPEDVARLAGLIGDKSMVELEEFLKSRQLPAAAQDYFLALPLLDGGPEVLETALELAFDEATRDVIRQLAYTGALLSELGYGGRIRFDLGKLPHFNYYTGLLFEGFAAGASSSVLSGGRYDDLMESFGTPMPAVGFALKIDPLAALLPDPAPRRSRVIRYRPGLEKEAYELAASERQEHSVKMEKTIFVDGIELDWEDRP